MKMGKILSGASAATALLYAGSAQAAVDSYRYLHVTIETPWVIFLGLAPFVMAPFLLMGVLVWRYAGRRKEGEEGEPAENAPEGNQE